VPSQVSYSVSKIPDRAKISQRNLFCLFESVSSCSVSENRRQTTGGVEGESQNEVVSLDKFLENVGLLIEDMETITAATQNITKLREKVMMVTNTEQKRQFQNGFRNSWN